MEYDTRLRSALVNWHVVSVLVGAFGFFSAIFTLFYGLESTVSAAWLVVLGSLLVSVIIVLIRSVLSAFNEVDRLEIECRESRNNNAIELSATPIKCIEEGDDLIFIIKRNPVFSMGMLVSIYMQRDGVEGFVNLGYVHHPQDDLLQIKLNGSAEANWDKELLLKYSSQIIIRPFINSNRLV